MKNEELNNTIRGYSKEEQEYMQGLEKMSKVDLMHTLSMRYLTAL